LTFGGALAFGRRSMARPTKRDMVPAKGSVGPPSSSDTRASGPAPRGERDDHARDERLRTALGWEQFDSWCDSNGLRPPPGSREAIGLVAVYVTFLAASGRNVAAVARALLRAREGNE
jgi:hypothetical protein